MNRQPSLPLTLLQLQDQALHDYLHQQAHGLGLDKIATDQFEALLAATQATQRHLAGLGEELLDKALGDRPDWKL